MEDATTKEVEKMKPGYDSEKAKVNLPQLDILALIQMIVDVAAGGKSPTQAAKDFSKPYQLAAVVYAKEKASDYIAKGLSNVGLEKLNRDNLADSMVNEAEKAAILIKQYMAHGISERELVEKLGNGEIREITEKVLSSLGIHEKLGLNSMSEVMKLAPLALAFSASVAAYQELRKALDDLALAKQERLQIEAACQKSIEMIRQYREEMECVVNQYMTTHHEAFESGFAAMDRALMENDIDGYIKGNAEIQSILGYHMQFRNQSEFDLLMDSDESFKL